MLWIYKWCGDLWWLSLFFHLKGWLDTKRKDRLRSPVGKDLRRHLLKLFLWQERELRPIKAKWLFQDRTAEPRHQSRPSAVSAACHCPLGEDVNKINVRSKITNSTLSYDFCPFYPENAIWVHAGLYTLPPSLYSWSYHHSQSDCGCLQGFSLLRASSSLTIHSLPPKLLLKNFDWSFHSLA